MTMTNELFDDVEDLVVEEEQTITAKGVTDLDDLDALMEESVAFAKAKKAKVTGRKLNKDDEALLASLKEAAAASVWVTEQSIAYVVTTKCACGQVHEDFVGWYLHQWQTGKGKGQRLVKVEKPAEGKKVFRFDSVQMTGQCARCLPTLLEAIGTDQLKILGSLNRSCDCQA